MKIVYKRSSISEADDGILEKLDNCERAIEIVVEAIELNAIDFKDALNAIINILPRLAKASEVPLEVFKGLMQESLKVYEEKWDET